MQAEDITQAALAIDPRLAERQTKWQATNLFIDAGKSAESIPWYERPAFVKLMVAIAPGDHLIVWRWDRIDRGAAYHQAVEWIQRAGIQLHVLEEGSEAKDLAEPSQELLATIHGGMAKYNNAMRRLASMRAKKFLKDHGIYRHGMTMPGYRRVVPVQNGRRGKPQYRHDEAERVLIRELGSRVRWGNLYGRRVARGVREVLADFNARGEVTAQGGPWKRGRMQKIARWWLECLDRGLEPWVDCQPYDFEPAVKLD
jgi:DNA invertase Pin-like site-specific DNA recombinase